MCLLSRPGFILEINNVILMVGIAVHLMQFQIGINIVQHVSALTQQLQPPLQLPLQQPLQLPLQLPFTAMTIGQKKM